MVIRRFSISAIHPFEAYIAYCLLLLFLLTLVFFPGAVVAQDLAELEVDHALSFEFQTPHTTWAKPYVRGKVRVLFFTDGRGTNPRECVELMQRFDIDAAAVFWVPIVDTNKSQWHGDKVGEQRMLNLLEQKWDCFVFLGLSMSNVPPEQKQKILKVVAEGAGIVFVESTESTLLQLKNRIAPLPPFLATGYTVDAYLVGEGRGIHLPDRPNIEFHEGWEVEYDYWQEFLGRAVLWASGKEPDASLQMDISTTHPFIEPSVQDQVSDSLSKKLTLRLSGKVLGENPTLHLSIRRLADTPLSRPAESIIANMPIEFQIPELPAGSYHADAIVTSSAGVETWATMPFRVAATRKVVEVKLIRDWGEIGDSIEGSVLLDGEPLSDEFLRVQVLDRRRRELLRQDLNLSANTTGFSFKIQEWLPMLVTVEAEILSKGKRVSRAYQYFRVTKRNQDKFNFLIWDVPRGTLAPYAEESLAKHGVTLQLARGNPPLYVSAFNIAWLPYTTRVLNEKDLEGVMKPFCWNNEESVQKHLNELAASYVGSREHGTFAYSLGDENETQGSCLSSNCAVAYRRYLKEVYGSLESVNRSWGTDFLTWEDVDLSRNGDDAEEHSLQQKNYPRWFDRQAFKSWNYIEYCQKYRAIYREIDPRAKTGFEGAGKFVGGDDLDLIVRSFDFWTPYPGLADEVIRSIAPRNFIRSNWMGYTKDADSLLQKYWRMVTLGMDSVWWWRWDCVGQYHGWLAPDLAPYPAVKEILKDIQVVRDGLGDLLLKSKMLHDGIAVLYSYPSTFAHKLDEGASYGSYQEAHLTAIKLLRAKGFQFSYVTDRMLRLGEFDATKYKVLILPRTEAIGDIEAEVIRKFVEDGGTVIADLRPGLYDDHCKPRTKGVLDDLFGVTRAAHAPALITTSLHGILGFIAKVDPGIRVNSATPGQRFGDIPVLLTRQVGKGTAVLLNCDMNASVSLLNKAYLNTNQPMPSNSVLTSLLARVVPQIKLENREGQPPDNIQVTRWQNGGVEIVSLFRESGSKEYVTILLPEAQYVYDLRNQKSLGRNDRFTTLILPSRASFFVLCQNPLPLPQLTLDKATVTPGSIVNALLSVPKSEGLHAFRIQVRSGGLSHDSLSHPFIVIVGQDAAQLQIPIAFNDPAGEYEVYARDLFTNQATSAKLTVR